MCRVWRGYDVAGIGGGEFTLWLILHQKVAPLYWRSDTHTHISLHWNMYLVLQQKLFLDLVKKPMTTQHNNNNATMMAKAMDGNTENVGGGRGVQRRWPQRWWPKDDQQQRWWWRR